jgi:putative transposase
MFARKIVGSNVVSTLRADILPLRALDMAAFNTRGDLTGLTHHSDHGSNYMALVYTERIVELGATPQQARSATVMTMPSLRRSTGSTKPN